VSSWEAQAASDPAGAPRAGRRRGLRGLDPEFGVSAFVLLLGLVVLYETTLIPSATVARGPVGPRAVPFVIGASLVILSIFHALDVARGGHGEAEAGEDIEAGTRADWRTVALVVVAFVANIFLIEILGWILSGALLFWVTARALGSRHAVRDVAVALAMGVVSFLIFAYGLGLALPGGILEPLLP
jgi:putative tricarboxylic transport membrane protein